MRRNIESEPSELVDLIQLVSNFNHNTNLLLAGTEFTVFPQSETELQVKAAYLREILEGFGAIVSDEIGKNTRIIWILSDADQQRIDQALQLSHPQGAYPLIVADAMGQTEKSNADDDLIRPGIESEAGYYRVDCTQRTNQTAPEHGQARINWAKEFMPISRQIATRLGDALTKKRIGIVLVLEPKTAVLALQLQEAGAQVAVFAPANETDQPVADYLSTQGIVVFADSTASARREQELAEAFLDWKPQILMDDGAHLLRRAHQRPEVLAELEAATEETTSGVRPLRAMEEAGQLRIPVIAVNDAHSKTFFDNRHGTGQTCVLATSDLVPESATQWAVIGFGPVGQGVAESAKALQRNVTVVETDPLRALQAKCAGYQVVELGQVLQEAKVIISATGYPKTITAEDLMAAQPGTVFSVAGGVPGEIELPSGITLNGNVDTIERPDGSSVTILAGAHGVNYTAAEGNPIEIMDLSFATQLQALQQLHDSPVLAPGVHLLSPERDREVAQAALEAQGNSTSTQVSLSTDWQSDRYHQTETVTVYSANLVIPVTAPHIPDGAVAIKAGKIIHVGNRSWVLQTLCEEGTKFTEEHWQGVLTPGLINAHTHLQYTNMAAVGAQHYLGFDDWARAFDDVYDNLTQTDWLASALRGTELCLASGTTAVADVVTDQDAATALHSAGLHGIAYWEVMGWSNEGWRKQGRAQALADLERIPRLPGVGVSPHAPYSLEVQPLLDVPDLVRNLGMRLHIHLGEAHFERETRADESWPSLESPSFRALRREGVGVSSTKFVDQLGVLGPDCHIAHGVYLSAEDRALLRARGTSVALCPRSNEVIGLDMPPIAAYLREGNQISVGTDSLSSSPSLDLLEDVALLYRVAREQDYTDRDLHHRLFKAATLGGAGSLGLRAGALRAGQLAVGASADLAFFAVNESAPNDALAHLVEAGAGTCRRTIVAGVEKFRA